MGKLLGSYALQSDDRRYPIDPIMYASLSSPLPMGSHASRSVLLEHRQLGDNITNGYLL